MTTSSLNIFSDIALRGGYDEIPNVGALAVGNHIFRTERDQPEIDVFSTNEFVQSMTHDEYLEYLRAGYLGMDNNQFARSLDRSVYQYLLYYYLISLNDTSNVQFSPHIASRYLRGIESTDPSVLTSLIDMPVYEFRTLLNTSTRDVRDLDLRVLYAPILKELIDDYPMATHVYRYINDTIMKSSLGYRELPQSKRVPIQLTGVESVSRSVPTFYQNLESTPLSELLFTFRTLERWDGTDRYEITFANSITMMGMISDGSSLNTIYQYQVGTHLNKLHEECPFVLYSYGLLNNYIMERSMMDYIPVNDNRSEYGIGQDVIDPRPIYLSQWLSNSVTLREFMSDNEGGLRFNQDGEIVEQSAVETFKSIYIALLTTLEYLYDQLGFVHHNLTYDSISIRTLPEPIRIELPGRDGIYFNSNHIPIITDFMSVSLLGGEQGPEVPLIGRPMYLTRGSSIDSRFISDQKNIMDFERLFRSVIQFSDEISSWDTSPTQYLLDELIASHYQMMTGDTLDIEQDSYLSIKNRLLNAIGPSGTNRDLVMFRSLPFQWDRYDVKRTIDKLINDWSLSDDREDVDVPESPIDSIDISDLITSTIEPGWIAATTYSGMIMSIMNPRPGLRRWISPGVEESFRLNRAILHNAYNDRRIEIQREGGNYVEFNLLEVQALYRDQILTKIDTTITGPGRRWFNTNQVPVLDDDLTAIVLRTIEPEQMDVINNS